MRAYVLVKVSMGHERTVLEALQGIAKLAEIHFLFGEFDYILTIEVSDTMTLARLVSGRIRRVPGVAQTVTLLEAPL